MHSYRPYIILHLCTVIWRAIMPSSWKRPSWLLPIKSWFAPSHVQNKKVKNKKIKFLLNAILCWPHLGRLNRKVHFTVEEWTVQSIYAMITGLRFFKMISVGFVTWCMLTLLTFCVSTLYMFSPLSLFSKFCFLFSWRQTSCSRFASGAAGGLIRSGSGWWWRDEGGMSGGGRNAWMILMILVVSYYMT